MSGRFIGLLLAILPLIGASLCRLRLLDGLSIERIPVGLLERILSRFDSTLHLIGSGVLFLGNMLLNCRSRKKFQGRGFLLLSTWAGEVPSVTVCRALP